MDPTIVDHGRGPQIAGTRITVFDVLDYSSQGWHASSIALWLGLSTQQVQAALRYIEEHSQAVTAEYQKILDRAARGNPAELQAKLDENHQRFLEMSNRQRVATGGADGNEGNPRGQ